MIISNKSQCSVSASRGPWPGSEERDAARRGRLGFKLSPRADTWPEPLTQCSLPNQGRGRKTVRETIIRSPAWRVSPPGLGLSNGHGVTHPWAPWPLEWPTLINGSLNIDLTNESELGDLSVSQGNPSRVMLEISLDVLHHLFSEFFHSRGRVSTSNNWRSGNVW